MKYYELQERIESNIRKKNLSSIIPDWINEIREDIAKKFPLRFLLTSKQITPVSSTYSYTFDKGESTGRYGGFYDNVNYDNGTKKISLDYANSDNFGILYPVQSTGVPSSYTVRGNTFTIDKVPSSISAEKLNASYYMLPDKLTADYNENYIDKQYYDAIINLVCVKALVFTGDQPETLNRYQSLSADAVVSMVFNESIVPIPKEIILMKFGLLPQPKEA